MSEKAQRRTRRGRENQRGCANRGRVCDCSISITFDIIIPGLKKKKNGGGRFQREALDESGQRQPAAAEPSPTQNSGSCKPANPNGRRPCCLSKGGKQEEGPPSVSPGKMEVGEDAKLSGYRASQAQVSKREFGHRHSFCPLASHPGGLCHSPDSWLPVSCGSPVMGGFMRTKAM